MTLTYDKITGMEHDIMRILYHADLPYQMLSALLDQDGQNMMVHLCRMKKKGLVQKNKKNWQPTEKGMDLLRTIHREYESPPPGVTPRNAFLYLKTNQEQEKNVDRKTR